ncbi:hypothetical protein SBF1_430009 [Candidatus Desulfosporosinus infrequens]|uniref:Uncharacterized protein n=1 Tax=Candidatus Desulfosporosinus infrequens TaxID=2043169 RepID=A0A2U3LB07_9FIRM|nr:hypothetical protein SBF1_430009 [Candidatus Desulfosporosinus infrequens]
MRLREDKDDTSWKYAYPPTSNLSLKGKLPHSPWVMKMDDDTHLPIKDKNGKYTSTRTAGFSGTQADVIREVQSQNVFMLTPRSLREMYLGEGPLYFHATGFP